LFSYPQLVKTYLEIILITLYNPKMSSSNKPVYPSVCQSPKFPEIEEKILQKWKTSKIFEKSVSSRTGDEFVFYDGPPFANGLPHYGHLLTGYVKDIIPRYQTMRGKKVDRRFGWDCHGLPAEMETEKELKVSGRQAIQELGIDKFNEQCRLSVLKYASEWERTVNRQGRWVSFENDYKTMDSSYMESVIWAFSELYKKGLVYEGYKVMPYSWACETPLSNFEIRMDNAYRSRQDPAITVAFNFSKDAFSNEAWAKDKDIRLLIWTTTPWTLPSNLAVAVGESIEYSAVEKNNIVYVLATDALNNRYKKEIFDGGSILATFNGSKLVGKSYTPIFPYFAGKDKCFVVLSGDFVTTEDGTGIVHTAPGFGEEDQKVCEAAGITLVCPVDNAGKFTSEITDYVGRQVQECNKDIIKALKESGRLIRHDTIEHNYPHCWRTDTPLIYKAVSSWYVRVTDFKDRMVELNQQINWIPDHIKDGQFGKWLENARDWSISRNRFWGTPIPIWKSDNPSYPRIDVYGSVAEIEKDFGVKVKDLHRPYIDELVRPNPDDPSGKSMMRRVEEVFDCWFESGSMPYAQVHYPFENKEWFENHFPADFIVEYIAQTRGWFYTLMVLSTALFDRPPFKNCMCHGVVLAADGQKLSKRLRNYPDPDGVFNTIGSDALRWFLVASPILRGGDLSIDKDGKSIAEVVRTVCNPIWNAFYFYTLYANTDNIKGKIRYDSKDLLDRYILGKTGVLVEQVTQLFDKYDIAEGCNAIINFIDSLNNWYIRRSRDRFWKSSKDQDKIDAYDTLYTVLVTLCKVAAPVLPFLTEEVYTTLTSEESVHLAEYPPRKDFPNENNLVVEMDLVRAVCSAGLSLRESHNLRTRLPLKSITVAGSGVDKIKKHEALIKEELNVKSVLFSEDPAQFATYQLSLNARAIGPRVGEKMKALLAAAKEGSWQFIENGQAVSVLQETFREPEYQIRCVAKQGVASLPLPDRSGVVVLDTTVTKDLEDEGLARDLVRSIQQTRKDKGLHVSDRIKVTVQSELTLDEILKVHGAYIAEQTLADSIEVSKSEPLATKDVAEVSVAGKPVQIALIKV
jgi:isoleucyl-tRNA synthetase